MDNETFFSAASATASVISALAAWAAIWYSNRQSKKQQKIIDEQNAFLQATTRIDFLNRRKETLEEIIKECNRMGDVNDKNKLFHLNQQYFMDNETYSSLIKATSEVKTAQEEAFKGKWHNSGELQKEVNEKYHDKMSAFSAAVKKMETEIKHEIYNTQSKINQLEASLTPE